MSVVKGDMRTYLDLIQNLFYRVIVEIFELGKVDVDVLMCAGGLIELVKKLSLACPTRPLRSISAQH